MPEDKPFEKKLPDPAAGAPPPQEPEGGKLSVPDWHESPKIQASKGGFFSAMAFKSAQRKGADANPAPSGIASKPSVSSGETWEPEGWESEPPDLPPPPVSGERETGRPGILHRIRAASYQGDHVLVALVLSVSIAVILSATAAWKLGSDDGKKRLIEEQTAADVRMSAENNKRLNQAFEDLRGGRSSEALMAFQEIEAKNPDVASMAYLSALAAMRSRNFALAEEQAERSIRRKERVSDSMAIQALLQIQKSEDPNVRRLGDQTLRAELILRSAMLADPANPVPMIELASLLRQQRKSDEAIELLKAARSRVQPFDLPLFLEATIVLATLQGTADADLPVIADPGKDLPSAISAAYVSMRRGQFTEAAEILRGIRNQTAPGHFRYLMNDLAIRPYFKQRELGEFFR